MNRVFFKDNRGVMLMDVMVAIGIIALLAVAAIPMIRQFYPNMVLSASAREMITDIRYAQQLTVTEQSVHKILFDDINGSYSILKIDSGTTTVKSVILDSDITIDSISGLSDDCLVFNFYGAVQESGQIVLVNESGKTVVVDIRPSGYALLN